VKILVRNCRSLSIYKDFGTKVHQQASFISTTRFTTMVSLDDLDSLTIDELRQLQPEPLLSLLADCHNDAAIIEALEAFGAAHSTATDANATDVIGMLPYAALKELCGSCRFEQREDQVASALVKFCDATVTAQGLSIITQVSKSIQAEIIAEIQKTKEFYQSPHVLERSQLGMLH
jgi:hypothetical protein